MPAIPTVKLKPVIRADVKMVAAWLEDSDVADSWFGYYSHGEPAHLGYNPKNLITASEEEWNAIFHDPHSNPHREIFSIYNQAGEHIGEAQISVEELIGDAQVSILIGDKNNWGHGYGTASCAALLEHGFEHLTIYRVWADIPEHNRAVIRMFEKMGFHHDATLRNTRPHKGGRTNSVIMGILLEDYRRLYPDGVQSHVTTWDSQNI